MKIAITSLGTNRYQVSVEENTSRTVHEVIVTADHLARYASQGISAETLLQASFEFLLERESKESILPKFDLAVIERYFPEYPKKIRERLRN